MWSAIAVQSVVGTAVFGGKEFAPRMAANAFEVLMTKSSKIFLLLSFLISGSAFAGSTVFFDLTGLVELIKLPDYLYYDKKPERPVRIAIFDQGFAGFDPSVHPGRTLPKVTRLMPQQLRTAGSDSHGFQMAQAYYQLLTNNLNDFNYEPELYLFNVFERPGTLTNLRAAVSEAIELGVDIVVCPQVMDVGSNFDGKGPFNAEMNRLVKAGILWINSAGNYRQGVFNGAVTGADSDWAPLGSKKPEVLAVECRPRSGDECRIRVALAWNDVTDDSRASAEKDLDLYVFQGLQTLKRLQAKEARDLYSELKDYKGRPENLPGRFFRSENRQRRPQAPTRNNVDGAPAPVTVPWEIIEATVKTGFYYVRVKAASDNFDAKDRLRISITGKDRTFIPADTLREENSNGADNLQGLADNPNAVTVGSALLEPSGRYALDPFSSASRRLNKPELYTVGVFQSELDEIAPSTSYAAMVVAAGATAMVALNPAMKNRELFLQKLKYLDANGKPTGPKPFELPFPEIVERFRRRR
jgi:hypothetical protein